MPLPVTPWTGDTFPTAKSLNLALYTCDGTLNKPNGILWHAQRYITSEVIGSRGSTISFPSSPAGGTRSLIGSSGATFPGVIVVDAAGYYGQTSDGTYLFSGYTFAPAIAGGKGDGISTGGWTIVCHFIPVANKSTQQAAAADLESNGSWIDSGSRQRPPGTVSRDNTPFYLGLQDGAGQKLQPAVLVADTASTAVAPHINPVDSTGETPRFFTIWAGVSNTSAGSYGTPAIPAPYSGYTASTTIGTTGTPNVNLNGAAGITGPMNYLANPPLFATGGGFSQSIPTGTATQVTLPGTSSVDQYGGNTSGTYTVQRPGLYLAHGVVPFTAGTASRRNCGISVNGTVYWGPGYQAQTGPAIITTKTQIFSLNAGDTVQLWCQQDTGSALTLDNLDYTRIFLAWLGESGTPSTLWTPPDTSFRWSAGTQGINLPALFQQHLANDIGFLVNRPYLMAYQASAQSGFSSNTTHTITMDTVAGLIHGDTGDNYSGWSGSGYTSQAAGWYLCVFEGFATFAGTPTTAGIAAGFSVSSSGGRTPGTGTDYYQQMFAASLSYPPGATAVGLYYLLPGETISPELLGLDYTATTWGTVTATGTRPHFECIWISS